MSLFSTSSSSSAPRQPINEAHQRVLNGGPTEAELMSAASKHESSSSSPPNGLDRMLDPDTYGALPTSSASAARGLRNMDDIFTLPPKPQRAHMKLSPVTGRTVALGNGLDLSRGMRLLEQSCLRNRIKSDSMKQRFHERPGLKRKRLRRDRWRKKFKDGFKATVARVVQLKRQGW